jgi:hypothetical protein
MRTWWSLYVAREMVNWNRVNMQWGYQAGKPNIYCWSIMPLVLESSFYIYMLIKGRSHKRKWWAHLLIDGSAGLSWGPLIGWVRERVKYLRTNGKNCMVLALPTGLYGARNYPNRTDKVQRYHDRILFLALRSVSSCLYNSSLRPDSEKPLSEP